MLSVGDGGRPWMRDAWDDYTRRMPKPLRPLSVLVDPAKGGHARQARYEETARLLRGAGGARAVVLDRSGAEWSTERLAQRLSAWRAAGRDIALLIGGADGLDPEALGAAAETWSLGPLTLPHGLVRVLVAEQLYRAWSILEGHPYHRA